MNEYYIITFINTHEAINAENEANKNKIKVTIIPTPTYITKSCGISLMVEKDNFEMINKIIEQGNIKCKNIYLKEGNEYKTIR